MNNKPLTIYLIAGEASGDALGAKLMHALKEKADQDIRFLGVGGTRMQQEGLDSLFPMEEISLIGFAEILPHIPKLLKRIKQTTEHILSHAPDIVITIDSPGFNFKIAKKLQGKQIPLVHYVAPSVWAYKPERVQKVERLYDHLLLLLPFEAPYFKDTTLPHTFVGHPIIEEPIKGGDGNRFREKYGIPQDAPVLCVMPGSRKGEFKRLLPTFSETMKSLYKKHPNLYAVVMSQESLVTTLKPVIEKWPVHTLLVTNREEKADAYNACDAALVKSGTGSLEVSLADIPMIITYKVSRYSAWMLRRMMKVRFVNLVNLVLGKEVIPELLQEECQPDLLAKEVSHLLTDDEACEKQLSGVHKALEKLGMNEDIHPSQKAANTILDIINSSGVSK